MRLLQIFTKIILLIGFSVWLIACSGGGGDDGDDDGDVNSSLPLVAGVFLDSAVEGLTYQSGSNPPGSTDANGTFVYSPGETLTFSVGGVVLGTFIDGASVITPLDFGSAAAVNIARFLQTLDADGDPSNGIDITAAAALLADTTLGSSVFVLDTATFEVDITPVLETALGPGALLIDEVTAIAHLVSETVSPFFANWLRDHGRVALFPEISEIGVLSFKSGLTSEMWRSSALTSDGDGAVTVHDWRVDANGTLNLIEKGSSSEAGPWGTTVATIEKLGGSPRAMWIIMNKPLGATPILGTLLVPVPVTVFSLAGESGRTYDIIEDSNTNKISRTTFYPDGTLFRVEDGIQYNETWEIDPNGILVRIFETEANVVRMFVMLDNGVSNGGDILSIGATNLSGDPMELELQIDAMYEGTLAPVIATNPDGTIPYSFSARPLLEIYKGDPNVLSDIKQFFFDLPVSGTFDYDSSVMVRDADDEGNPIGWPHYDFSILNLAGSVDGMQFSDPSGVTLVVNDQVLGRDVLELSADPVVDRTGESEVLISDLVGFDAIGYTLVNVQLIWTEGEVFSASEFIRIPDFLSNGDLPTLLPNLEGFLVFEFTTPANPGEFIYASFPGLALSPLTVNPPP